MTEKKFASLDELIRAHHADPEPIIAATPPGVRAWADEKAEQEGGLVAVRFLGGADPLGEKIFGHGLFMGGPVVCAIADDDGEMRQTELSVGALLLTGPNGETAPTPVLMMEQNTMMIGSAYHLIIMSVTVSQNV